MAEIKIGDKTYVGKSVSIVNGVVVVDGKRVDAPDKQINIEIFGDVESINVDYCEQVKIQGHVKSVKTGSGDVQCQDVSGNVDTQSGEVNCDNVSGNVRTMSGDIDCTGHIQGDVETMSGDIEAHTINGGAKTVSGKIKY